MIDSDPHRVNDHLRFGVPVSFFLLAHACSIRTYYNESRRKFWREEKVGSTAAGEAGWTRTLRKG